MYGSLLLGHPIALESILLPHPRLHAPGFNLTMIYAAQGLSESADESLHIKF